MPEEEVLKNPSGGELRISKRERERESMRKLNFPRNLDKPTA